MSVLCCIQCSMRALLDGEPPPVFAESPEDHMARVHPDPEATQRERAALEARLDEETLWRLLAETVEPGPHGES